MSPPPPNPTTFVGIFLLSLSLDFSNSEKVDTLQIEKTVRLICWNFIVFIARLSEKKKFY